jgi:hypothetical protein
MYTLSDIHLQTASLLFSVCSTFSVRTFSLCGSFRLENTIATSLSSASCTGKLQPKIFSMFVLRDIFVQNKQKWSLSSIHDLHFVIRLTDWVQFDIKKVFTESCGACFPFGREELVFTAAVELYQICEMKAKKKKKRLVQKFTLQYFYFDGL